MGVFVVVPYGVAGAEIPTNDIRCGSSGSGESVTTSTIYSDLALALTPSCPKISVAAEQLGGIWKIRLVAVATASAFMGVPSWKVTPSLSLNSHVSGLLRVQDSASKGCSSSTSGSLLVSVSN